MKIALAQLNYHIGNFEQNTQKILNAINRSKAEGADLVVFAELAISGYPPRDFLSFDHFVDQCHRQAEKIAEHCVGIAAIVGLPVFSNLKKGKKLRNAAYFMTEGKIQSIHHKSLLPTYDIFDEYRYFEPASETQCIRYKGKTIALTICEDLWNVDNNPLYLHEPMEDLSKSQPDFMINIAASPFHKHQQEKRMVVLRANAQKFKLPLIYVNHVGAQTELIFDGSSAVLNAKGALVKQAAPFKEDLIFTSLDNEEAIEQSEATWEAQAHQALVLGIRDYFKKLGFKKAVVGLSGGIDSALTFALATEALGKENMLGVIMPSDFSSQHSIDDAKQLANNLGTAVMTLPVQPVFNTFQNELAPGFKGLPFGLAEENLQARIRGTYLMTLSNKFGHIVLNTSNKSEAAVGYGTLYGDMCGGLAVLGDVYKTEVWQLARYLNRNNEIIPENSIIKAPSAELRPDQYDSDSLPDYDILDKILIRYIEHHEGPEKIKQAGFNAELVDKVLQLVNVNEYKRFQTPPILRVSSKAFGMGRRMPIVAKYLHS